MVKLVTDTNLTASVNAAVAALVAGAPGALDTLNELATALGDDANFAATVTAALGNRLTWRGAWAPATNYVTNDVVTFNGGLYRAPNNFTSAGAFVLANWVELHAQTGTYASPLLADYHGGRYVAAYNGNSNETGNSTAGLQGYGIGFAYSDDGGRHFFRIPGGKFLSAGTAGQWDDNLVKDPALVKIGERWLLFYMGSRDGNTLKIGLATSTDGVTFTRYAGNPIIDPASGSAWENASVYFPHAVFDTTTGLIELFYSGQNATGTLAGKIGHATFDPIAMTLTKDVNNPLIAPAAGEQGLQMGCVYRDPFTGLWHMWTGPFNTGATSVNVVYYTASAPGGPWTRQGVVLSPRPTASKLLTANAAAGDGSVTVADSSVFTVGEPVYVQDSLAATAAVIGADNWEVNFVQTLTDATHIALRNPLANAYTTARAAEIVSVYAAKIMPRSITKERGEYVMHGTAWFAGNQTYHEDWVAFTASSLAGPWSFDLRRGVLLEKTGSAGATSNNWDKTSSENPSVISESAIRILDAARRQSKLAVDKNYTAGDISLNAADTNWHNLIAAGAAGTGLDCFLPARPGDRIRLNLNVTAGDAAATFICFDVATVVYPNNVGTIKSYVGGDGTTSTQGIAGWRIPTGVQGSASGSVEYVVKATDIENGWVNFRLQYRRLAAGTTRSLQASTTAPLKFSASNLGGTAT